LILLYKDGRTITAYTPSLNLSQHYTGTSATQRTLCSLCSENTV